MHEMDRLLENWMRQNEPSKMVVVRMRDRLYEQIAAESPVNPQRLISSIFAEAFQCLRAPVAFAAR
jgi:hypothetical protein